MPKMATLVDHKFGKLTVLEEIPERNNSLRILYKCRCDCGNIKIVDANNLRLGKTQSCGCFRKTKQTPFMRMCKRIYKSYKSDANRRNLDFQIKQSDFEILVLQDCFYCGRPPNNQYYDPVSNISIKYSGIDRYDNKIGYYLYNCVSCCVICNKAKRDLTPEEFFSWLHNIFEFNDY